MESKRPLAPSDNFDMTLEECRLVFDTMDNLIIIDERGRIKYFSPNMYSMVEAYNKRPLPDKVVGKHVSEVPPATKILNAARSEKFDETCFYFASDVTNIARIKNLYRDGRLVGAIDYDIFTDGVELKEFLQKVSEYAEKGFINLQDTFQSMYETSKKQQPIKYCVTDIIGKSQAMTALRMQIAQVSESNSTVLVTGKTGCGKEMVAHSIHNLSRRCKRPMITINCAAIPEALVESELFGYEEGSFTGAKRGGRIGKFEMADKSTVFLDEVDQLPYHIQPKLLRVLQEREIMRLGDSQVTPINIRVIAATNKPLDKMVADGRFREDLFYRLRVLNVDMPPLRERKDDILLLAWHFLRKISEGTGTDKRLDPRTEQLFLAYNWPGNVRELQSVIQSLVTLAETEIIAPADLPSYMRESASAPRKVSRTEQSLTRAVEALEKSMLAEALAEAGSTYKAARRLGISQSSVVRKAKKYGIHAEGEARDARTGENSGPAEDAPALNIA